MIRSKTEQNTAELSSRGQFLDWPPTPLTYYGIRQEKGWLSSGLGQGASALLYLIKKSPIDSN